MAVAPIETATRLAILRPGVMDEKDRAICAAVWKSRWPLAMRRCGEAAGLRSSSTAWVHVTRLVEAGWLALEPGASATIRPGPRFVGWDRGRPLEVVG